MTLVTQSQLLLVVTALLNVAALVYFWHRGSDGFRIRFLILVSYFLDNVLSGLVHVFGISRDRGFYDALTGSPTGAGSGLVPASWACLLGLCALIVGLLPRRAHGPRRASTSALLSWSATHRRPALTVGIVMTLVCAAAWVKVRAVTADTQGRIIAVGGGNARYVTLSGWLPLGITLVALCLMKRQNTLSAHVWNALVMLGAVALMVVSMAWSGERSGLVFSVLPLLAIVWGLTGRVRWPMLGVGVVSLSLLIWQLTQIRSAGGAGSSGVDLATLIDWQWGRFSMSAWAFRYIDLQGTVHGETLISTLLAVPDQLAHFAGVTLPYENLRTMVEITGQSFTGMSELIYIVPGYTSELIVNFGMAGVVVGYLVLGLLNAWLADLYRNSRFELQRVLIVFAATIVCLSTIVAATEAFFQELIMGGLPLFVLAWWEYRSLRNQPDPAGDPTVSPNPSDAVGPGSRGDVGARPQVSK